MDLACACVHLPLARYLKNRSKIKKNTGTRATAPTDPFCPVDERWGVLLGSKKDAVPFFFASPQGAVLSYKQKYRAKQMSYAAYIFDLFFKYRARVKCTHAQAKSTVFSLLSWVNLIERVESFPADLSAGFLRGGHRETDARW